MCLLCREVFVSKVCPVYGTRLEDTVPPRRVVSFVSSATEALFELGCGASVIGVTPYCARYVPHLEAPVVGDYLRADVAALRAMEPDLVLVTQGIQAPFGKRMAQAGLPVFALPLPASRWGVLEQLVILGSLMQRMDAARQRCDDLERGFASLLAAAPPRRPKVFVELWFGRHLRTIGGASFIHDLIWLAGGEPLFGHGHGAYPKPDLSAVPMAQPDVWLLFQEPDFPVDGPALQRERGWTWPVARVDMGVTKGANPIHDGVSLLDTAWWLHARLAAVSSRCGRTC